MHEHQALPEAQRSFHGVRQARGKFFLRIALAVAHNQPVNHGFNRVQLVAVQLGQRVVHIEHCAIHTHARKARFAHAFKHSLVVAFAVFDQRRQQHNARAFLQRTDCIHNALRRLLAHLASALRAVRRAHPRKQKPQIIVNLGNRAHRRTRIF